MIHTIEWFITINWSFIIIDKWVLTHDFWWMNHWCRSDCSWWIIGSFINIWCCFFVSCDHVASPSIKIVHQNLSFLTGSACIASPLLHGITVVRHNNNNKITYFFPDGSIIIQNSILMKIIILILRSSSSWVIFETPISEHPSLHLKQRISWLGNPERSQIRVIISCVGWTMMVWRSSSSCDHLRSLFISRKNFFSEWEMVHARQKRNRTCLCLGFFPGWLAVQDFVWELRMCVNREANQSKVD